ncbi:hypothetical protein B0T10DRAFT_522595 [Thelonectria olida]|uniref:Uncharacterized protein n=1 Tax=Thelonectria olida TaxID=1576542 RepID=A0A9P9AJ52_9HYPO|nr:hypothetical protein B0T10DRAFT_522595 [Thelonectria olida]
MALFQAQDLKTHMKLLDFEEQSGEFHDTVSTPVFTETVGKHLLDATKANLDQRKKALTQYGLLAGDISEGRGSGRPLRVFYNVAAPSSVFICGSQGSGKSHTLATLLENCLVHSAASTLTRPLVGLVFHYDSLASDVGGLPCEAAYLSSHKNVKVRVLCPPTNTETIKKIYSCLPNVSVQELRFSQDNLNTKRMLNLMAAHPGQGGRMPLYLHTVMRVLRELRIHQQRQGVGFDYQAFRKALEAETLTEAQSVPLYQRLETLESFMVKQNANTPGPVKQKRKMNASSSVEHHKGADWTPVSGQLTVVDLSCPCVTAEQACSLFDICLSLFLEQKTDLGRVVALDESHKYMTESPESQVFAESLLSAIRLQPHNGTRVIISTQEPTVSPRLLDLCNITVVHRFSSPVWLQVLRRHLAGASEIGACRGTEVDIAGRKTSGQSNHIVSNLGGYQPIPGPELFENIVNLRTGEAFLFAPSAVVGVTQRSRPQKVSEAAGRKKDWQPVFLGDGVMKVQIRKRITVDGGMSIMAR